MIAELIASTGDLIHANPWMAMVAVFFGGVLTASNPCVLAMIPLTISFVAGRKEEGLGAARAFGYSLVFVLGLGITFTAMGMVASLAGRLYGETPTWWNYAIAVVCLVMGLHLAGVLRFTIPMPLNLQPRTRGVLGALVLGLAFGLVSAPCAAPILVVLLTYLAGADASVVYGGLLLMVYALGHSILVLVAGTSMGFARKLLESQGWRRTNQVLRIVAGVLIVLVGVFFAIEGLL